MSKYDLNERPGKSPGTPRLMPEIGEPGLNRKLGPRLPKVRATSGDAPLRVGNQAGRRERIPLPGRFR